MARFVRTVGIQDGDALKTVGDLMRDDLRACIAFSQPSFMITKAERLDSVSDGIALATVILFERNSPEFAANWSVVDPTASGGCLQLSVMMTLVLALSSLAQVGVAMGSPSTSDIDRAIMRSDVAGLGATSERLQQARDLMDSEEQQHDRGEIADSEQLEGSSM